MCPPAPIVRMIHVRSPTTSSGQPGGGNRTVLAGTSSVVQRHRAGRTAEFVERPMGSARALPIARVREHGVVPDPWWLDAVVYQIYPRSFADSDGDGVGDVRGIIGRVDHLVALGIDVVWLSPIYRSPQDDNGYDISDYQDVDPLFGSLVDL